MKKIMVFVLVCIIALSTLSAPTGAMQRELQNPLREILVNTDAMVTAKVQSVQLPTRSENSDQVYSAVLEMRVGKTYSGTIDKVVTVTWPMAYFGDGEFSELGFKAGDALLLFLGKRMVAQDSSEMPSTGKTGESGVYRALDGYKIVTNRLRAVVYASSLEYMNRYDTKKLSVLLNDVKRVQKELSAIRIDGGVPTRERLRIIHRLDNLMIESGGCNVIVGKVLATMSKPDASGTVITSLDNSVSLQLEKTPFSNATGAFFAQFIPAYSNFEKGKAYVLFIQNGTNFIQNCWYERMEYQEGYVIMEPDYGRSPAKLKVSAELFAALLKACPTYVKMDNY